MSLRNLGPGPDPVVSAAEQRVTEYNLRLQAQGGSEAEQRYLARRKADRERSESGTGVEQMSGGDTVTEEVGGVKSAIGAVMEVFSGVVRRLKG